MHIVLTDVLICPDCGVEQGLVARADRINERRIESGALGCPGCKRQYPIEAGVAFLDDGGPAAAGNGAATGPPADPAADALKIAALLGLDRVNGFVLLMGSAAACAAQVAQLGETVEIVAAGCTVPPASGARVSRLVVGKALPFLPGRLRGVWLAGGYADSHLETAIAALHPTARLVLDPVPDDVESRLPASLRVLAREDATAICGRAD